MNRKAALSIALLAILVITILMVIASSAAAETTVMYVCCSPDGSVNIRERPNIHSNISGRLYCGDSVEIVAYKNGWCKAADVTEWGYGWIRADYLLPDPLTVSDTWTTVEASGRVAIRCTPDGKRSSWAQPGDTVHVIMSSATWSLTDAGYIKTEYLRGGH